MIVAWRTIAVVLICLFSLINSAPDIALPWRPTATFGFTVDAVGTIVDVQADSPAARAHLAVGERIDFAQTPTGSRQFLSPGASNNAPTGRLGHRKCLKPDRQTGFVVAPTGVEPVSQP